MSVRNFFFLLALLLFLGCTLYQKKIEQCDRMHGLSFVAPPYGFSSNPMEPIRALGATHIAVIPIAYTRPGKPSIIYNQTEWQWWGERPEGVKETLRLAAGEHLEVMLKPQIYVPGSWTGGLEFKSDADWEKWEDAYRKYILPMAKIAEEYGVQTFCIGTEFKISTARREEFWRNLIKEIRAVYGGKLTYAANWDEYKHITFWDDLDYIGVDAYFPLSDSVTPSVAELKKAWKTPKAEMETIRRKFKKPLIFTEYGYLSVDGCAGKTWELEPRVKTLPINQQAQANAVRALHEVFSPEDYWAGGFIWKWFPEMQGHEGYPARDYTPQGKLAEQVLRECFAE